MPVTRSSNLPQRDPGTNRVRARSEGSAVPDAAETEVDPGTPAFLAGAEVKDAGAAPDASTEVAGPDTEPTPEAAKTDVEPTDGLVHRGGGWYELPNGERVHGREAAEAALGVDG